MGARSGAFAACGGVGVTVRKTGSGTTERWLFHENSRALRSSWPTADSALFAYETATPEARAIIDAYVHILTHPAGTEAVLRHVRELRRAEKAGVSA